MLRKPEDVVHGICNRPILGKAVHGHRVEVDDQRECDTDDHSHLLSHLLAVEKGLREELQQRLDRLQQDMADVSDGPEDERDAY